MKSGCFVLLLIAVAPAWSAAQGLGDAAARERQKRQQTAPATAKVFTEADLEKPKAKAEGEAAEPAEPAAKSKDTDATDPALRELERERQERKLQEAEWRVRFAGAREQVALAEAACWHEVIRTEFYQGIPVQMKVKEFVESEEFRQAKRALADLEEQFRQDRPPAGLGARTIDRV